MTDRSGGWLRGRLQAAATEAMTAKGVTINALAKELHMPIAVLEGIVRGSRHGTLLQWSALLNNLDVEMHFSFIAATPAEPAKPECTCPLGPKCHTRAPDCPVHGDPKEHWCTCPLESWWHRCSLHGVKAYPGFWDQLHLRGARYATRRASSPFDLRSDSTLDPLRSEVAGLRRQIEGLSDLTDRRLSNLEARAKLQQGFVQALVTSLR